MQKQIEWKPRLSAIHGAVFLFFMTVVPGRFVLPHHAQDMQLALRVVFAPMEASSSRALFQQGNRVQKALFPFFRSTVGHDMTWHSL